MIQDPPTRSDEATTPSTSRPDVSTYSDKFSPTRPGYSHTNWFAKFEAYTQSHSIPFCTWARQLISTFTLDVYEEFRTLDTNVQRHYYKLKYMLVAVYPNKVANLPLSTDPLLQFESSY